MRERTVCCVLRGSSWLESGCQAHSKSSVNICSMSQWVDTIQVLLISQTAIFKFWLLSQPSQTDKNTVLLPTMILPADMTVNYYHWGLTWHHKTTQQDMAPVESIWDVMMFLSCEVLATIVSQYVNSCWKRANYFSSIDLKAESTSSVYLLSCAFISSSQM